MMQLCLCVCWMLSLSFRLRHAVCIAIYLWFSRRNKIRNKMETSKNTCVCACTMCMHALESVKLEENFRKDVNNPRKKNYTEKTPGIELHLMQLLCCCCSRIMRLTLNHFVISVLNFVLEKCSNFQLHCTLYTVHCACSYKSFWWQWRQRRQVSYDYLIWS